MTIQQSMHRCSALRVLRIYPENGNSITLGFLRGEEVEIEFTVYGLPQEAIDTLLLAFGDAETQRFKKEVAASQPVHAAG